MAYEIEAERIEAFVRKLGWPVSAQVLASQLNAPAQSVHPLLGPLRAFATGWGRFTLTARDNVYLYEAPPLQAKEDMPDEPRAQQIALRFAEALVPDLQRRFERRPPNHASPSFNYTWMQRAVPPQTSVYPNTIDVRVDSRYGAVTRFACTDLAFERTTPPRIDEASARARILAISGGSGIVDQLTLSEDPRDANTRSETIWYGVVLREGGPYGVERQEVVLHADTGERYRFEGDPPLPDEP